MAAPQLDAWLAGKAQKSAPAGLQAALTLAALAEWLAGAGLPDDQRAALALSTRQRVDALTLAALDAAAGEDADGRAGVADWILAGAAARTACGRIAGGLAAGRADAKQQAAGAGRDMPSDVDADAFAAWQLAVGLRAMHALWVPQFDALGPAHALPHPLSPLCDAWIEAHAPGAPHASGVTGIAPRMQTTWRRGELPAFDAPAGAVVVLDSDAPALAYLPGMGAAQAAAELLPPFWWDLVEHAMRDPVHYGVDPRRARTDALRVPRIALYVAGLPLVRDRVGVLRVNVATRDLVWALYPGDRERRVLRTDRLAPTQRSLEQLDAYSRRVDGGGALPYPSRALAVGGRDRQAWRRVRRDLSGARRQRAGLRPRIDGRSGTGPAALSRLSGGKLRHVAARLCGRERLRAQRACRPAASDRAPATLRAADAGA